MHRDDPKSLSSASIGTRHADRVIRSPRGTQISARSWLTEAPLRMLMNNLDPEVAENPKELVVYGGIGRAARDWECYDAIVDVLRRLGDDETLLIQSGKRMREHQRAGAFGMHGGEQCGQVAALRKAEQGGALRSDGVHDDGQVVHPLLERGQLVVRHPIGKAGAALVEDDEPGERREPFEEPRQVGLLPRQLDVGDPARDVHKIEWPLPDNLVGDMQVAALGVMGFGHHGALIDRGVAQFSKLPAWPDSSTGWPSTSRRHCYNIGISNPCTLATAMADA